MSPKATVARAPGAAVPIDCIGNQEPAQSAYLQTHLVLVGGRCKQVRRLGKLVEIEATQCYAPPKTAEDWRSRRDTRSNSDCNATGVHSAGPLVRGVSLSPSQTSNMAPALCLRKTPAISTIWDSPKYRNAAMLNQRPNVLTRSTLNPRDPSHCAPATRKLCPPKSCTP